MSHANLNRRSRGDEAVRSSRPTLLTRAAFSTSLRHQVATSLSPRMLTFLSQVPDLTFLTLRFQPAPSAPSAASAASAVKNRFVSIPGFFPTSLRHHVAMSLSPRMSTFPSQVPAIINSNDQIACEDFRPNACAHRHARTLNCRLFFCKSLQSSFSLSHHDSRSESLLWGNQLVAGLTAKRFVITVVQTSGSPLPAFTIFTPKKFHPSLSFGGIFISLQKSRLFVASRFATSFRAANVIYRAANWRRRRERNRTSIMGKPSRGRPYREAVRHYRCSDFGKPTN